MFAHKIFCAFVSVFYCFSIQSMVLDFEHLRTTWETANIATYTDDAPGKEKLLADISKIVELKFDDGFVIPFGSDSKSTMETGTKAAISTMLDKDTGIALFKTLITKLFLRREAIFYMYNALDRYNQNIQKNCLLAAAGSLYRMAKIYTNSTAVTVTNVNKIIDIFSSSDSFKEMLDKMLLTDGWEMKCHELLGIPVPTKDLGAPDDEDGELISTGITDLRGVHSIADPYGISQQTVQLLGLYLNTAKIRITNEKMTSGHCYYTASDGTLIINIHFPTVAQTEIYALPNTATTAAIITRTFSLTGETDQTRNFSTFNLNRRLITDIEEVLFHEGGHCLHGVENRDDVKDQNDSIVLSYSCQFNSSINPGTQVDMVTDISVDLTSDWINPEELRNAVGIVLMKDGSIQRDIICTYKYDKDCGRSPRWPYRDVSTAATVIGDFIDFVKMIHP